MSGPRTAAAVAGLALLLYLATLSPGLAWGDSADLQLSTGDVRWDTRVRAYPLWTVLATAFHTVSGLEPANSANVLNALLGAAAVALMVLYAHSLTGSPFSAAAAGTTLAVSHLMWSASTAAEVYTLSACFLVPLLMIALRAARGGVVPAAGLGLLTGLSLLHHRMIQLCAFTVGIVLLVQWTRRERLRRSVPAVFAGFCIGAAPFIVLAIDRGLSRFLIGGLQAALPSGPGDVLAWLLYVARFLAYNMAGPQLLLLLVGGFFVMRRGKPEAGHVVGFLLLGILLPLFLPNTGDRYVFMLPAVIAGAVLVARGSERITGKRPRFVAILLLIALCPAALYWTLAHSRALDRLGVFENATGTHTREFLWPGKAGDDSADRFGRTVLEALPPDAVILTEWGEGRVISYLKHKDGLRPDVTVKGERLLRRPDDLRAESGGRPVYFSPHPLLPLRARTAPGIGLEPVIPGTLYKVTGIE